MANPHVLSFSARAAANKEYRFTVGTDVIDYMESSRAFGREDLSDSNDDGRFQRRMVAIPDKKGDVVTPMVLTISNQNQLYLVRKDDESKSGDGWKLIDLSQAFKSIMGNSIRVRAQAAAWTDHDRITIAVAVDDGSSQRSRVFVAYDLSSRSSNWEKIAWIDCGSREDVHVEGIRVLDRGDGTWTVVLAGDRGPNDTLYLLRNNAKPLFNQALIFNTAITLKEILDFEVAVHPTLGCGIVVLGRNGETTDLSFRPFPEYKADGSFSTIPPVQPLPCPLGANVLETGLTKQVQKTQRRTYVGSDIYIGGKGVHLIKAFDVLQVVGNGGDIPLTVVAQPNSAPDVQNLIAGEAPDGSVSAWFLLKSGELNTVKKAVGVDTWGEPLCLRVGIQEIAPVHGDDHLTTSLLTIYANGQASFLCRDASQGIWQERPLTVANREEVTKITCYGTTLRILGDGSLPQPGIKVKVSASVLSSVVLNGCAVFIGPNLSFETQTDGNGGVSLFDRVRSITPSIYRFEIDGFSECVDVDPASGIHERFQSMTADELRSATISTPNGNEPLLPESFRTGADRNQVDAVAGGLNNLSKLASSSNGVVTGVSLVNPGTNFSSTLKSESLPDNFKWGIHVDSQGVHSVIEEDINNLIHSESAGEFFKNLGDSLWDCFEGAVHAVEEVTFILHKVEESKAFQFICKIGSAVKKFVVETAEQIGSAIIWLWNKVKTGLEKVWEYVKFLLNWQDILLVRDLMVSATDEILQHLQSSIGSMQEQVEKGFDSAISQIEQWKSEAGIPIAKIEKPSPGTGFLDVVATATETIQDVLDQIKGNSTVAWITEQVNDLISDITSEIIQIEPPTNSRSSFDSLNTSFVKEISTLIGEISHYFEQVQADINTIFEGKFPKLNDLSFETVERVLASVSLNALEGLLNVVKKVILEFMVDIASSLIGFVRDALFTKIRLPFVENLIKVNTDGLISVDTSFSMIEAMMLLCAVPTTIAYKTIFGNFPFKKGDVAISPFGSIVVQSGPTCFELLDLGLAFFTLIMDIWKLGPIFMVQLMPSAYQALPEKLVTDTYEFLAAITNIVNMVEILSSNAAAISSSYSEGFAYCAASVCSFCAAFPTLAKWGYFGPETKEEVLKDPKFWDDLLAVVNLISLGLMMVGKGITFSKAEKTDTSTICDLIGPIAGQASSFAFVVADKFPKKYIEDGAFLLENVSLDCTVASLASKYS